MLRAFIEMGEYGPRLVRDEGGFVIFSCKLTHGIQRFKAHDRDEFNFLAGFAAQQLNVFEAGDVPVLNADEDLLLTYIPLTASHAISISPRCASGNGCRYQAVGDDGSAFPE